MITAVQTIMGEGCPYCRGPLTRVGEAAPWCGMCEWNLDAFSDDHTGSWFWRRVRRADRRAGFRSDRQLARSAEPLPIGGSAYRLLTALSATLMLIMVGHELGHLKHEDHRRSLLLQPAGTAFGRLARAVKPPHNAARIAGRNSSPRWAW